MEKNRIITEIQEIQRLKYIVESEDISKFKKWICKTFNLKPPKTVRFYMTAGVSDVSTPTIGEYLETYQGIVFKVKNISSIGGVLRLESKKISLGSHNLNLLLAPDKLRRCKQ